MKDSTRKAPEPQAAPRAEIISFAQLKGRRDAARADLIASAYVISGEPLRPGDMVLCETESGAHSFGMIKAESEDEPGSFFFYPHPDFANMKGIVGKVVLVNVAGREGKGGTS